MHYLFKENNTAINPEIKDTDFREYYPAISPKMSWRNIKPYITEAYHSNILPYIGDALYQALLTNEESVTPDATLSQAADLLKRSLALYAVNLALPEINTHISDGAMTQPTGEQAQSVTQWAFNAQRWNLIIRAEKNLDIALDFIIRNNIMEWAPIEDYSHDWMSGPVELNKYIRVNGHRAYMNMRPYFDSAVISLRNALTCLVVRDIESNIAAPAYEKVVFYAKKYIAQKTLEITIPRMITYVEGSSLIFMTNADGIKEGTGVYSRANIEATQMLIQSCREEAGTALDEIITIMKSDPETFSVFKTYSESLSDTHHVAFTPDIYDGKAVGAVGFF